MAGVKGKKQKRVWIDSQTEEEILRGIKEAKDVKEYDNLAASAYLRAKEDYLMGINFSRLLTLEYGNTISNFLKKDYAVISVGRVMTCVLGMIVRREREIRSFVKTPFYRVIGSMKVDTATMEAEWKVVEGSDYFGKPVLYKDNGFLEKETALAMIDKLSNPQPITAQLVQKEQKNEKKAPPLLFNLAELQNTCAKRFKISPDQTLQITQELYEKKLVTYPRTDARVLSTAVAKEIDRNLKGLQRVSWAAPFVETILESGSYKTIAKTKYTNDKLITDHYAIIPTGQGLGAVNGLSALAASVYETIVRRFLAIFYPAAVYKKASLTFQVQNERFFSNFKVLAEEGYLKVSGYNKTNREENNGENTEISFTLLNKLKKGDTIPVTGFAVKEGETSPPKRYNSGSMILAMENAGQLIEDEELRAQIKGSGIGTSATRAEILKKLIHIKYISLNKKTQIITPTLLGEMVFDVVNASIRSLLNPELTASWEKGLSYVAEGSITPQEYMVKLEDFIKRRTQVVLGLHNQGALRQHFTVCAKYYGK
jgi:DNA topoisomerase-3